MTTATDWIKTSQQLPPEGRPVLTKVDYSNGHIYCEVMKRAGDKWYLANGNLPMHHVPTHWFM